MKTLRDYIDIIRTNEGIASDLAKGASSIARQAAPATLGHLLELVQRQRGNLAQISQLATNPNSLPDVLQRLKALHSDLYDIAHYNNKNPQILAQVNQLRDWLAGIIRHTEQSASRMSAGPDWSGPMMSGMLLQYVRQDLVPILTRDLAELEQLVKAAP